MALSPGYTFDIENERRGEYLGLSVMILGIFWGAVSSLGMLFNIPYISYGLILMFASFLVYTAIYIELAMLLYPCMFLDEGATVSHQDSTGKAGAKTES
jgi:cellulose synthase/poly-beta-1,6-N-acetylglucosamine synthase-like glycosyltransferase